VSGIHSSLVVPGSGQPLSKLSGGMTRAEQKAARKAEDAAKWAGCCKAVDARDQGRCRVCGRRCSPTAIGELEKAERHHLIFRSQGGVDESWNVVTICKSKCHGDIHTRGTLKLSGDADARDERGKLTGVCVQRPGDGTWEVRKWV
jgi:hypothetical protein